MKHKYSDEKVKRCKQEFNDSLELDKAVFFLVKEGFDLKLTYKFLRSINGKAKVPRKMSYKITSLSSGFAICEAFDQFFASVYKIDNEPLNVQAKVVFQEYTYKIFSFRNEKFLLN